MDEAKTKRTIAEDTNHWREKFNSKEMEESTLVNYFQLMSPHFFKIDASADFSDLGRCSFDEKGAEEVILSQLHKFICGDDFEAVFIRLKSEGSIPSVCGRVFKTGEPNYSCRECGIDPTCVLCVNCFKQSAHRNHRYRMSTSSGGGCCDCGDCEAWKRDPYCDQHILGTQQKESSSVLTEEMLENTRTLIKAVMHYCITSLEMESNASSRCLDGDMEEDVYCTVLYNDETHTFDQVIQTLIRFVGSIQKDAIEYVSSIDREGRAIVKCAPFQECSKLKSEIEAQSLRTTLSSKTAPLIVAVLHKNAVANQQFALQLLEWLQKLVSRHVKYRDIFCEVGMQFSTYNINHVLVNDWKLWKTARTTWHRLLIAAMLMEHEHKMQLAVLFTKLYPTLTQDYIADDHDHSFSIVSLSVQLFTVPSIAQHLIANESALFKLMHTFYAECIEKHVKKKVLHFAKNTTNVNVFKRASYILFDLKYILSFKPTTWTDDLRKNFLHGVQVLIRLLREMQGMDSVFRQTGQHMEYEPEWESAFNLHIKLANVIALVLDWCSTDKVVLIKVYRMVLANLQENEFIVSQTTTEVKELADHSASVLMYDVSSKPVSIHLPLSRFFAGLYLHLSKFDLTFDNIPSAVSKPSPVQIIEPVLCTLTMVAQVHAGMWRRNGYSLLNQLYFYRNVKCRSEMLDRDIVVMQIGASLIENNEFLIHVLNKFGLIYWPDSDFENNHMVKTEDDNSRQVVNMVDEMLELLIVIIGERYVPGISVVTEEDKIKKEIIQQLCIKPFSHSELTKTIPEDAELGDVIDSVAVFKKPTQCDKKGVYELKDEFYDSYTMYFYHYTKEDKSKSEEVQRKRRKAKGKLVCCPPPKLPQLTETFSMIASLLQCDVMLLIIQTVLKRAADLKAKHFSETHLQKVLYLIGYGLQEEESGFYPFLVFKARADKWGILPLMEELITSARVEAHRDLIIWTVKKYKELNKKNEETVGMDVDLNPLEKPSADAEKAEKELRAQLAAARRANIMEQMKKAQSNFMSVNAEHFTSTNTTSQPDTNNMEWQVQPADTNDETISCMGPNRKVNHNEYKEFNCILCSEESLVTKKGQCMVYSVFVQRSKVLSGNPEAHTGSCGHVMHATCWTEYFENEVMKEHRRPHRNRSPGTFLTEKREFLCPLCRRLSNAVIPLTPALSRFAEPNPTAPQDTSPIEFYDWMKEIKKLGDLLCANENLIECKSGELEEVLQKMGRLTTPLESLDMLGVEIKESLEKFMMSVRKVNPCPNSAEVSEPFLTTITSCAYTIQSLEMLMRAQCKPLKSKPSIRYTTCLSGLVRSCGLLTFCSNEDIARKMSIHFQSPLKMLFNQEGMSILECDLFRMLVTLIFITPCVLNVHSSACYVPNGSLMEYYYLKLVFMATIAKVVLLHELNEINEIDEETSGMDTDETPSELVSFYKKFNVQVSRNADILTGINHKQLKGQLLNDIKGECFTFLRSCCLLFHFMTDVEIPDQFVDQFDDKFEHMCDYLGLSSDIESYFADDVQLEFMSQLLSHKEILEYKASERNPDIVPCYAKIKRLVDLSYDYSDLINGVSTFICPNNEREDSRNPTMCLVCGNILCSMTYCCQVELDKNMVGACTYHAHECGAGIGMFLRIRECEVLLLEYNKGCFVSPPYLDEYRETDPGLRRGNPLHLCKDRYDKLHLMWLGHDIYEEIARSNESSTIIITTQWQHL